ncbi:MAG TPA: sulfatase-like hydrolase/transferase, partial [Gemmataceae bacterium]
MKRCLLGLAVVVLGGGVAAAEPAPPNILLITADDLNCDSVGAFGGKVPGATPNIDRLASEGMRFARAHVTVAVCQPCRNALMTGRYPHRCGGEGFFHLRVPGVPILPDLLRKAGYTVGILSKVPHSTPYANFKWDMVHDNAGLQRNPDAYAKYTREFLASAKKQGKPFFLMANANDPHRPFLPTGKGEPKRAKQAQPAAASRLFEPSEVVVPGFLPDLPPVREEVAAYFGCVRRCDDTVGA